MIISESINVPKSLKGMASKILYTTFVIALSVHHEKSRLSDGRYAAGASREINESVVSRGKSRKSYCVEPP